MFLFSVLKKQVDSWKEYWALDWRLFRRSVRPVEPVEPVEPGQILGQSEAGWLLVTGPRGSGVGRVPVCPRSDGRGLEVMN